MEEPRITPLARRLAEENGIDWRRLKGTGPDGTIVERDILAFLAKVMAGEVDLPPMPEEPPPVLPEEDLRRAQEALGREGVDLAELLPEPPKAPTPEEEAGLEEALDLEPALLEDLELDLEEELLLAEEPPASEALEEELRALLEEEAALEAPLGLEAPAEAPFPTPPEPAPEPPPAPAPGLAAAPAPVALPGALRVYRKRVELAPLEGALEAFHRVQGTPKTPLPFLVRAAERALAELELPLRPLLGQAEEGGVRGLRPAQGFLALFYQGGGEEGEGLLCFTGEEELHTGRPSLFLSPEGVLAASGLEGAVAQKLLERVALYLENPVLLLA